MTPNRPYLLRAFYDWIIDNRLTPYVVVNADYPHVEVPEKFIEDGKIVLNVAPQAINDLSMGNYTVEFDANFSGHIHHIYLPVFAVTAIYAYENGRGIVFSDEEEEEGQEDGEFNPPPRAKGPPKLRVVK
jgi:stringent starvation protein B